MTGKGMTEICFNPQFSMQLFYCTQKETWQNKDLFLRPNDHKINSRIWAKGYTFGSHGKACTCAPKKQTKKGFLEPI